MRITSTGDVGIGTSPSSKLDVNGKIKASSIDSKSTVSIFSTEAGKEGRRLTLNTGDADNSYIYNYEPGAQTFHTINIGGIHSLSSGITILNSGFVGIGTGSPDEMLTVKGKIHAEEVRVDLSVPGPDYVFEPTYDLKSLEEIEQYIKSEKHLPEIPSAKEMEANGVQLGEMNMLLLKKIEELTLHTIAQEKQLKKQGELEKRIEELLNRIEKLEKQ